MGLSCKPTLHKTGLKSFNFSSTKQNRITANKVVGKKGKTEGKEIVWRSGLVTCKFLAF